MMQRHTYQQPHLDKREEIEMMPLPEEINENNSIINYLYKCLKTIFDEELIQKHKPAPSLRIYNNQPEKFSKMLSVEGEFQDGVLKGKQITFFIKTMKFAIPHTYDQYAICPTLSFSKDIDILNNYSFRDIPLDVNTLPQYIFNVLYQTGKDNVHIPYQELKTLHKNLY